MLGRMLKEIFLGNRRQGGKVGDVQAAVPLSPPRYERRGRILVMTGGSEGDFIKDVSPGLVQPLMAESAGVKIVHVGSPGWLAQIAEAVEEPLWFVLSYFGVGKNLLANREASGLNLWAAGGIPLVQIFGDCPAYFPRAHQQDYSNWVNVYGHPEHHDFFRKWLHPRGITLVSPSALLDALPEADIDFSAKLTGKIIFPKNGNDPGALIDYWRSSLPPYITRALEAVAESISSPDEIKRSPQIDEVLNLRFADIGIDITGHRPLFFFLIAQLDDYLRRIKSTMMARALLDLPIEVRGSSWGHVNFSGRRARLVPNSAYAQTRELIRDSLAVLDMSPNTSHLPHDRILRAAGRHTAFLSNTQHFFSQNFENYREFTFDFSAESIRETVEGALANPARTVEMGRAQAARMRSLASDEVYASTLITAIDACALASQGRPPGTQIFVDYRPLDGQIS